MTTRVTKEQLHRLVDELPSAEIRAAKRYLEYLGNMRDPLTRALMEALEDDEPVTEEDIQAI